MLEKIFGSGADGCEMYFGTRISLRYNVFLQWFHYWEITPVRITANLARKFFGNTFTANKNRLASFIGCNC